MSLPLIFSTALAPVVWGSSYIVINTTLPDGHPLAMAALRALTGGTLLMLLIRQWPKGADIGKVILLGAMNFTIFWAALFIASSRLPGGIAATLLATQSLFMIGLGSMLLGLRAGPVSILAALGGIGGIALMLLDPVDKLDPVGVMAAIAGSCSMALGMILTRRWQAHLPPVTSTAWQLSAGGIMLALLAAMLEPGLPVMPLEAWGGMAWLGIIGAALTYILWFRGVAVLPPGLIGNLGFLSPVTAFLLAALVQQDIPTPLQMAGIVLVFASILVSQRASVAKPGKKRPATA